LASFLFRAVCFFWCPGLLYLAPFPFRLAVLWRVHESAQQFPHRSTRRVLGFILCTGRGYVGRVDRWSTRRSRVFNQYQVVRWRALADDNRILLALTCIEKVATSFVALAAAAAAAATSAAKVKLQCLFAFAAFLRGGAWLLHSASATAGGDGCTAFLGHSRPECVILQSKAL